MQHPIWTDPNVHPVALITDQECEWKRSEMTGGVSISSVGFNRLIKRIKRQEKKEGHQGAG